MNKWLGAGVLVAAVFTFGCSGAQQPTGPDAAATADGQSRGADGLHDTANAPSVPAPPAASDGYPPLPQPTLPVPKPPYAPTEPHPVDTARFTPAVLKRAIEATGRADLQGGVEVANAWQITERLQIGAGYLTPTGAGALITLAADGSAKLVALGVIGAPGPATIRGVKGDLVLLSQGFGYLVFNYQTGQVQRSDENANPR